MNELAAHGTEFNVTGGAPPRTFERVFPPMATEFTQSGRLLAVKAPVLRDDTLLVDHMMLTERLSKPFLLELDLKSDRAKASNVKSKALLGKSMSLEVRLTTEGDIRHVHGMCNRFAEVGKDTRFVHYRAEVVPWTWLMSLDADCRIFQDMTVPEILDQVFREWQDKFASLVQFDIKQSRTYYKRDYCVQYRETDFNFVSRLMEEEGFFFFFRHEAESHTLVVVDSTDALVAVPGQASARHCVQPKPGDSENSVATWEVRRSIVPGKYVLRDYNFQMPDQSLEFTQAAESSIGGNDILELYDYPGGYAHHYNKPDERLSEVFEEGPAVTKVDMQEAESGHLIASGTSNCRAFLPGFKFDMLDVQGSPLDVDDAGSQYVITSIRHSADQDPDYDSGVAGEPYRNSFTCIPASANFRPSRITPRPLVQGLQTAVVVGSDGKEIEVDKYGRIKVQFHWDREGKKNEDSSCWIRVAQAAAGTNWGTFFWPRIGHEVLVAFLEGDPDQPIVVGSVYNYNNMPPYTLPEHKTRSGFKTRSTLKGNHQHFNELRFEDKKNAEEIYLHAEKDLNAVVENNETRKVGAEGTKAGNQTVEIFNNQTLKVGTGKGKASQGDQVVDIWNNQEIKIGSGKGGCADGSQLVNIWKDREVVIETGNDVLGVLKGNRNTMIDTGNDSVTIRMGNQTTKLDLGKSSTQAMQSIELKVGKSSVKVDQTGVTIEGMIVKINGTLMTEVKGMMTNLTASGVMNVKGSLTMIN